MSANEKLLRDALEKLWAFASKTIDKHGENGDATMTEAEHREWQDAGGAANYAMHATESLELHVALEVSVDERLGFDERLLRTVGPFRTGDDARRYAGEQANDETLWTSIQLEAVPT